MCINPCSRLSGFKLNPYCPESFLKHLKMKINLNFYFHTPLLYVKRLYEGLNGLHKTFWGTTKECENKNLS